MCKLVEGEVSCTSSVGKSGVGRDGSRGPTVVKSDRRDVRGPDQRGRESSVEHRDF